jgi:hypothetical protein
MSDSVICEWCDGRAGCAAERYSPSSAGGSATESTRWLGCIANSSAAQRSSVSWRNLPVRASTPAVPTTCAVSTSLFGSSQGKSRSSFGRRSGRARVLANLRWWVLAAWNHVVQRERCAPRGLVSKQIFQTHVITWVPGIRGSPGHQWVQLPEVGQRPCIAVLAH